MNRSCIYIPNFKPTYFRKSENMLEIHYAIDNGNHYWGIKKANVYILKEGELENYFLILDHFNITQNQDTRFWIPDMIAYLQLKRMWLYVCDDWQQE